MYLHKETFEAFNNIHKMDPAQFIEVDELIAPVIKILNLRGWATQFCCSGHAYGDCGDYRIVPKNDINTATILQDMIQNDCDINIIPFSGTEVCEIMTGYCTNMPYIYFDDAIVALPHVPKNWTLDNSFMEYGKGVTIRYEKPLPNNAFDKNIALAKIMKDLGDWADSLPLNDPQYMGMEEYNRCNNTILDL